MSDLSILAIPGQAPVIGNQATLAVHNGVAANAPVLNLNAGIIKKGRAITTTNPAGAVNGWLYIAAAAGTFTNFASLVAAAGDGLLFDGTTWQLIPYTSIAQSSFVLGKNLYDHTTRSIGQIVSSSTGVLSANAQYDTTAFIEVLPGKTYTHTSLVLDRIAFFDLAQAFVSGVNGGPASFTVPANCYFVKIAIYTPLVDPVAQFQVELGSTETYFEPYGLFFKEVLIRPNSIAGGSLVNAGLDWQKTSFFAIGKNKYNPQAPGVTDFFKVKNDGTIDAAVTESASDYIPVTGSQQYKCNRYVSGLAFYDLNKKFIPGSWVGSVTNPGVTSPASAVYCRVSFDLRLKSSFQIEPGAAITFYERYQVQPQKQIGVSNTLNYQDLARLCQIDVLLPSTIRITAGHERTLYLSSIVRSNLPFQFFNINVSSTLNKGSFYGGETLAVDSSAYYVGPYYQWPAAGSNAATNADAGSYTFKISFYLDNIFVYEKTIDLVVIANTAGAGINRKLVCFGESLTLAGVYPEEVKNLFAADPMDITLVGGMENPYTVFHEGHNGFTWYDHLTNPLSNIVNAGVVDMNNYETTYNTGLAAGDWALFLGFVNDVAGQNTLPNYAAVLTNIDYYIDKLDTLIGHVMAKYPGIRIAVCTPVCPANGDAWGHSVGGKDGQNGSNAKLRMQMVTRKLIDKYDTPAYQALGVFVIDVLSAMDPVFGYGFSSVPINFRNPLITRTVVSDPLHPVAVGYKQVADPIFDFIKSQA